MPYLNSVYQTQSNALEVLDLASEDISHYEQSYTTTPSRVGSSARNSALSASIPTKKASTKPWLPLRGGECQFKCCHYCRPSLLDRSYLSLDGIANDDIPATAITGFGFNLQKYRPVALVKHVQNLGLRPNPPQVSHSLYALIAIRLTEP